MNMQVSLTTTTGLERRLEVAVPQQRVAGEIEQRLKTLSRTARLKGFRPGKVPYAVVRQQFGEQVRNEAVSDLIERTFAEAVTQEKLRPAAGPRIEPLDASAEGELRYAATFEVLPEVAIKPLSEMTLERPSAEIAGSDVDAMVESMRRQRPKFDAVERPAIATDRLTIAYEGRIDGEVFPGGQGDALEVVLGSSRILKELDEALIGMSVGEKKSVPARFPEDYGAKSVAGKDAMFQLEVKKIEAQSLPELDEAFVRSFGLAQGGVEEMRAEVQKSMQAELDQAVKSRLRQQLLDLLYANNPLEVPNSMVEESIRELQFQMLQRAGVREVKELPDRAPYVEPARKRVALGLIVGEMVRSQGIRLDRGRVEERLNAIASSYDDPQAVRRQYLQSREAMQQVESAVLEDQVLDWALEQVKFNNKPATFAELTGFNAQPAAIR